ncbi:MAG: DUF488 domain-containing protein [Pedobacter sp.]|nr:MAG: DUF488 domain-containing protein [Pedobacter sp.]
MFYRRKVVLALFKSFGGTIDKIKLQKLIFLVSQRQLNSDYQFVPYKFGCYSFSLKADLITMVKKGLLTESETSYTMSSKSDFLKSLKEEDKKVIREVNNHYHTLSSNSLIKYTYQHYPYWAINSIIAEEVLKESELSKVDFERIKGNETILYTIGYEGSSLEEYLNKLIKADVKVLIDVRNNPLSMKFGFSKTLLSKYCNSLNIKYVHYPEVGILSNQRQELNGQSDYDKLFKAYKKTLPAKLSIQIAILELLKLNERVALTCFEADICQCHRKPLAEAIKALPEFKYSLRHI